MGSIDLDLPHQVHECKQLQNIDIIYIYLQNTFHSLLSYDGNMHEKISVFKYTA